MSIPHSSADFISAGDLAHALGQVFFATLQGDMTPKSAMAIAYLGQNMLHSIRALLLRRRGRIRLCGQQQPRAGIETHALAR